MPVYDGQEWVGGRAVDADQDQEMGCHCDEVAGAVHGMVVRNVVQVYWVGTWKLVY